MGYTRVCLFAVAAPCRAAGSPRAVAVLTPFHFPSSPLPHVDEQKWSKGKMREKVANKVLFDQETYDSRLLTEIPKVRNARARPPHMPAC